MLSDEERVADRYRAKCGNGMLIMQNLDGCRLIVDTVTSGLRHFTNLSRCSTLSRPKQLLTNCKALTLIL
jgi:hypothetical protein